MHKKLAVFFALFSPVFSAVFPLSRENFAEKTAQGPILALFYGKEWSVLVIFTLF
jgi:hypothetical protein